MALETATYISDLVSTNPTASDNISQGDDHIRLLKATVKATFPNITNAMTRTHTDLNNAVTLAGSETLTNKTLTNPFINTSITVTPKSGTNLAGDNLTVIAGNGTGTGGSGYIAFQTAAAGSTGSTANTLTERMRIDNAGNVGIGTSSPADKFVVFGDNARSTAIASTTAGNIIIEAQASNYYSAPNYTGTGLQQYGSAATGTTVGLSNANLGILRFQNVSAGLIYTNGGSPLVFGTTFAERMRIDSSGNVGIGTTSPSVKLQVRNATASQLYVTEDTTGITAQVSASANGAIYGSFTNDPVQIRTNNTERLRIGTSGELGIGGANYGTSGQVLTSGGSGAAPSWATPSGITTGTSVATTSGSTIDFTGIPSTAKRIFILLDRVSFAGNSGTIGIQVGTSAAGVLTTGYNQSSQFFSGTTVSSSTSSSRFNLMDTSAAANTHSAQAILTNITGNTWVYSAVASAAGTATQTGITAGSIALASALDRIRLMISLATTFDAGTVNITYE